MPIDWNSNMWPVIMGIEHERIHLETSSVLIRQLDLSRVRKQNHWPVCDKETTVGPLKFIPVEGKKITLGK